MDEPTIDDKQVVTTVLNGDVSRFALLVSRYHGPLLQVAKTRLGREDIAEDAVQDAFICAFRSLHTYKPQFSFRTWLWTILLNQCRRHGSRFSKLPSQSTEAQLDGRIELETPDARAMQDERNKLIHQLLKQLPEAQADALRLRFFGQLKYQEIADAMQSSLSAAKQRVRYGLVAMSELLREHNIEDSVFPETKP